MMQGYNFDKITFFSTSGFEGDNMIERSTNLDSITTVRVVEVFSEYLPLGRFAVRNMRQKVTSIAACDAVYCGSDFFFPGNVWVLHRPISSTASLCL
ncbi:hypothetical protein L1887_04363 [Cichorium endivia]|nr:hypothetical protein L1887_04363 [Cichorium endivia]